MRSHLVRTRSSVLWSVVLLLLCELSLITVVVWKHL